MLKALRAGITTGKIIPVLCAAAVKGIGTQALLDLIVHEFPSPADRGEVVGTDLKAKQAGARAPDAKAPVTALVFKTLSDPHVGKLSLFRVFSGTLKTESTLANPGRGGKERMSHISWLQGKTSKNVESLGPGEIGVVQKLKETQTGDTWVRVEPMARGGGFEFVDDIFGGAVPRNFIPSVEKGVRDCMKRGILAGYPIVDLKVTLYDGSYHDVDSSDMAFQIAASMGLQKVFMDAHPILLEPIMNVEVNCPTDTTGDVLGDLNSRRGRIAGMEPAGETAVVRAQAPMAEMLTYEPSLRSMTGGRGGYSMEFSHYEEVPAFLAEKVIKEVKTEKEKQTH